MFCVVKLVLDWVLHMAEQNNINALIHRLSSPLLSHHTNENPVLTWNGLCNHYNQSPS